MSEKFCVKCADPIRDPQDIEDERCACCADDQDPLDCVKQEVFAEGWFRALDERDREDAESGLNGLFPPEKKP